MRDCLGACIAVDCTIPYCKPYVVVGLLVSRYVVDSNKSVCLILVFLILVFFLSSLLPFFLAYTHKLYHPFTPYAPRWCGFATSLIVQHQHQHPFLSSAFYPRLSSPSLYFLLQRTKKVIRVLVVSFPSVSSTGLGCCKQTKQKNKNVKMLPCLCSSPPYTPQRGISQYATVETPCFQVCC